MIPLTEKFQDILTEDAQARHGYGADGMDIAKRDQLLNDHRILITNRYTAMKIVPLGVVAHIVRVTTEMGDFTDLVPGSYFSETRVRIQDDDTEAALTNEEADKIIRAFEDISEMGYNLVVFHCFAGIQRSATLAMAFAYYMGGEEAKQIETLIGTNGMFRPHWAIYHKLCRKIDKHLRG